MGAGLHGIGESDWVTAGGSSRRVREFRPPQIDFQEISDGPLGTESESRQPVVNVL
jgi:hypothetical protein